MEQTSTPLAPECELRPLPPLPPLLRQVSLYQQHRLAADYLDRMAAGMGTGTTPKQVLRAGGRGGRLTAMGAALHCRRGSWKLLKR